MADRQVANALHGPFWAGKSGFSARLLGAATLCALAGCGSIRPTARYAGVSPPCEGGFGQSSTLVRDGADFAYAPADGALIIHGTIAADGGFAGSLALHPGSSGLDTALGTPPAAAAAAPAAAAPAAAAKAGSSHAPLVLGARGRMDAESARIDYSAGACRAVVTLARVHPPLL